MNRTDDPHGSAVFTRSGAEPISARIGLVLLHGRGASATDILGLYEALNIPDVAAIAPQAAGNSWWPVSFLAPISALEPWLTSALDTVERAVAEFEAAGLPRHRIAIAGFSQGACLALEYAARAGAPLHSVTALSGGLVGTADGSGDGRQELYGYARKTFDYPRPHGSVPVLLTCHESDPHIPLARVEESAAVLETLGAAVRKRIHPGAGHGLGPGDDVAMARLLAG